MRKVVAITPDRKQDYLASTILEGLRLLGCEIVASDVGNGVDRAWSDDDIVRESRDADHVIVFFGKVRDNRPPKRYLLDRIDQPDKVAYVDGSEWTCTGHPNPQQVARAKRDPELRRGEPWLDAEMLTRARWYFKRECYPQDLRRGIIPLPFAVMERDQLDPPSAPRDIDVLCSFGQVNDGLRAEVVEVCRRLMSERSGSAFCLDGGMSRSIYEDVLRRSRIVVDAWGGGDCCARFWEAVGASACVLRQRYQIVVPHDFEDGRSVVDYSDIREFESLLRGLLDDDDRTADVGQAARELAMEFHTSRERARSMLERMT